MVRPRRRPFGTARDGTATAGVRAPRHGGRIGRRYRRRVSPRLADRLADLTLQLVDCPSESRHEEPAIALAQALRDGGGNGCIIGRNTFQRPKEEAMAMLDKIIDILKGEKTGN